MEHQLWPILQKPFICDKTRQDNVLFGVLSSPMYIDFIQSYVYRLYPRPPPPPPTPVKRIFLPLLKTVIRLRDSIWLSHSDGDIR